MFFVGSALHPCITAFAKASCKANSISKSFSAGYPNSPTNRMTQARTGAMERMSADITTSK